MCRTPSSSPGRASIFTKCCPAPGGFRCSCQPVASCRHLSLHCSDRRCVDDGFCHHTQQWPSDCYQWQPSCWQLLDAAGQCCGCVQQMVPPFFCYLSGHANRCRRDMKQQLILCSLGSELCHSTRLLHSARMAASWLLGPTAAADSPRWCLRQTQCATVKVLAQQHINDSCEAAPAGSVPRGAAWQDGSELPST